MGVVPQLGSGRQSVVHEIGTGLSGSSGAMMKRAGAVVIAQSGTVTGAGAEGEAEGEVEGAPEFCAHAACTSRDPIRTQRPARSRIQKNLISLIRRVLSMLVAAFLTSSQSMH